MTEFLDQPIQLSGGDPVKNRKSNIHGLSFKAAVTDLAKHQIVAALNPIDISSGQMVIRDRLGLNPEAPM